MKSLPTVNASSDTFASWIVKTNSIIALCNTEVVTANSSANGGVTTGNGYVIGAFGANTVVATNIRGGNTISSGVLTVTSNTIFTESVIRVNNGIQLGNTANSTLGLIQSSSVSVPTTTQTVIDTFPVGTYRSAKYVVTITDSANTKYQATELLVLHNGTNVFTTEYATLLSNTALATLDTSISGGNVRLQLTGVTAPLTVNINRTLSAV